MLALLCLSAWRLNFRVECDFLLGSGLLEMPCFKRFRVLASIKWKKSFTYCQKIIDKFDACFKLNPSPATKRRSKHETSIPTSIPR